MTDGPVGGHPGYPGSPGYSGSPGYPGSAGSSGASTRPASPQPGVIPLRPLSVGEILDGAFAVVRWNPKAALVPSAIIASTVGIVQALLTLLFRQLLLHGVTFSPQGTVPASQEGAVAGFGLSTIAIVFVLYLTSNAVLTAILSVVVGQGVLGNRETPGAAWRAARPRVLPLIGVICLKALILGVGGVLAFTVVIFLAFAIGAAANTAVAGALFGVILGIATLVGIATIWIRWALTTPIVVLERSRATASLNRSWRLVRKSAWRVFGIMLLTALIVGVAQLVIRTPLTLISGNPFGNHRTGVVPIILGAIGGIIALTLTAPLQAGVSVLLYADLRMRREGLDIVLRTAASQPEAPNPLSDQPAPGSW